MTNAQFNELLKRMQVHTMNCNQINQFMQQALTPDQSMMVTLTLNHYQAVLSWAIGSITLSDD